MPGPFLLRGRDCQILNLAGLPPGLFPEVTYDEFTLQRQPQDSVLFFSDGLTDARSSLDEEFGLPRLREVCEEHAGESPPDLLGHIFSSIDLFTRGCQQWDDMTAAVFHYDPK